MANPPLAPLTCKAFFILSWATKNYASLMHGSGLARCVSKPSDLPWHLGVALDCGLRFQTHARGLRASPLTGSSEPEWQQSGRERRLSATVPSCRGTQERNPEVSDPLSRAPSGNCTGRAPRRTRRLLCWRHGSDGLPFLRLSGPATPGCGSEWPAVLGCLHQKPRLHRPRQTMTALRLRHWRRPVTPLPTPALQLLWRLESIAREGAWWSSWRARATAQLRWKAAPLLPPVSRRLFDPSIPVSCAAREQPARAPLGLCGSTLRQRPRARRGATKARHEGTHVNHRSG